MPLLFSYEPAWWWTALQCYVLLHLMSFACWPWFTRLFSSMPDRGAGLAMAGGILIYALASQLLWRIGFFELHFVWAFLLMVFIGISTRLIFYPSPAYSHGTRARMRGASFKGWVVFSLLFWYWAIIRSADPGVSHTEQPMDVMWMGAALASEHPPLQDAWLGGMDASYYADGHQVLAFLGLQFGLPLSVSVNMTQIIWFALTGLLAFQAGKYLTELKGKSDGTVGGLLAVLLVCFVSTPAGFLHAVNREGWWWWWNASRVITDGVSPLITEFPFFSFWLGDNHAHLIGLPILLLSVLAGIQCWRCRRIHVSTALLPMLCVAWSWRINPWQTPTALGIFLLCLVLRKRKKIKTEYKALGLALLPALFLGLAPRGSGPELDLVFNQVGHTSLIEFLKVFGFLLPGVIWMCGSRPPRIVWGFLVLSAGMFACVEVVYLQDAFQNRMNTVFKVYYQLWVLLGLLGAVGWARALSGKRWLRYVTAVTLAVSMVPAVTYAGRLSLEAYKTSSRSLNAWSSLPPQSQHLLEVATRLIQPGERIAEAPGKSYDATTSLLGTWTPGYTLMGWRGHQAQWRKDPKEPALWMIYEAFSPDELRAALELLEVDWVLIGPNEREAFSTQPQLYQWMDDLAYRVVDQEDQLLYRLRK